jgi:HlyD family secretion protein
MSDPAHQPPPGEKSQDSLRRHWRSLDRWIDARFGGEGTGLDDDLAHRFKSDAVALEEAPVPISAHAALYTVIALLVIAILWSILGRIDRIVVAPGKLTSTTPLIVMQPFTTSRILAVSVKPGDHVRKGQVLVSFDPAFAAADETSLAQKSHARDVEMERLNAELNGASHFDAGSGDVERHTQAQIFSQDMAQFRSEMAVRDRRVDEIDAQIKADNDVIAGLKHQVEMAQKVVNIRQYLADQKAGAPLDVMSAQSTEIDLENRLKNTVGDAGKLMQQRAETESERQTFRDKWRSDHNQQLVQARQDMTEASQTLGKARKMSDLTQLRAPADGVVLEVADRSVGSVLREAETLVTMVPDGASLYVDANVPSRDVSYVKVGQAVRVKLEAYPFQRYGTLDGVLDVISPDSLPLKQEDHAPMVYRARVRLVGKPANWAVREIRLRPGLVASAEIKTGRRSIASYILEPVMRTTDESMREP